MQSMQCNARTAAGYHARDLRGSYARAVGATDLINEMRTLHWLQKYDMLMRYDDSGAMPPAPAFNSVDFSDQDSPAICEVIFMHCVGICCDGICCRC